MYRAKRSTMSVVMPRPSLAISEISESMRCTVCFDSLSVSFRIIGSEIRFWEYARVSATQRATQARREPSCRKRLRSNRSPE